MSRSFLMDSIINSPHCGHTSPQLSSPASLPSSPGSPFPYPAFGGYLFSFGLQHPGFPKPMMYPPYPLYGLDGPDTKLVRPVPLPSLRKPPTPPYRQRPSPKPHRPVDIVIKPQTSPTHSLTGEYYYFVCHTNRVFYPFRYQFICQTQVIKIKGVIKSLHYICTVFKKINGLGTILNLNV